MTLPPTSIKWQLPPNVGICVDIHDTPIPGDVLTLNTPLYPVLVANIISIQLTDSLKSVTT